MKRLMTGTAIVAALVLVAGLLPGAAAEAGGEDVTFSSRATKTLHVLAAWGGDGECSDMPEKEQFALEAGAEKVVASGSSKVCYCTSPVGKISDCGPTWKKVKAGRTVIVR